MRKWQSGKALRGNSKGQRREDVAHVTRQGSQRRKGEILAFSAMDRGETSADVDHGYPGQEAGATEFLLVSKLPEETEAFAVTLAAVRFRCGSLGSCTRTLSELAELAGLPVSTARLTMQALVHQQYVRQEGGAWILDLKRVEARAQQVKAARLATVRVTSQLLRDPTLSPLDRRILAWVESGRGRPRAWGQRLFVPGLVGMARQLGVAQRTVSRRVNGTMQSRLRRLWRRGGDDRCRVVLAPGGREAENPGGPDEASSAEQEVRAQECPVRSAETSRHPGAEMSPPLGMRQAQKCLSLWEQILREQQGNHAARAEGEGGLQSGTADGLGDTLLDAEDREERAARALRLARWRCPPLLTHEQRYWYLTSERFRALVTDEPAVREQVISAILNVAGVFNLSVTQRQCLARRLMKFGDRPTDVWTLAAFGLRLQHVGVIGTLRKAGLCWGSAAAGYVLGQVDRDTSAAASVVRGEKLWRLSGLSDLLLGEDISPTPYMRLRVAQVADLVAKQMKRHSLNHLRGPTSRGPTEAEVRSKQREEALSKFEAEAKALAGERDVVGLGALFSRVMAAENLTITEIAERLRVTRAGVGMCIAAARIGGSPQGVQSRSPLVATAQ